MNSILLCLRLVSMVVRFFVCFNIGLDVFFRLFFILLVMIFVNVVLFKLGGLKINVWLSVFC